MGAVPSSLSSLVNVALMSPTSWPESSTWASSTPPASPSMRLDSMKPVDMSLTTLTCGPRVFSPAPPMYNLQRAGSHEGGLTS